MSDLSSTIAETRVRLCLDCGKCTVVCPVARYDPGFNPRLIVQRALKNDSREAVDPRIWSCLGCNMCTERCNYNVKFTDFIVALRERAFAAGAEVLYTHGGSPQTLMRLMAHQDSKQDRLGWIPGDILRAPESETAFFVGCAPYFDRLFADLSASTTEGSAGAMRLLNYAGIEFTVLGNERCCGRDLLLTGDAEGFLALARANAAEFKARGVQNIIASCPECYWTLKVDYPRLVDGWDINVRHITDVLAPLVEGSKLKPGALNRKVTFHDPCILGRYARIFDQPRHLLKAMGGADLREMKANRDTALCCGSSAWVQCGAPNKQIQRERLAQAGATGADVLVTACPKCLVHLRCAQKNPQPGTVCQIEVRDLYALVASSLAPSEVRS